MTLATGRIPYAGSWRNGALLELWRDPWCSSRVETGMLGNFLSYLKSVKDFFEAPEGGGISLVMLQQKKGLILHEGENLLFFLKLEQETWGSSRVKTGTSGTCSCGLWKVQSPCKLRGGSRNSSPVSAGSWVLIWS